MFLRIVAAILALLALPSLIRDLYGLIHGAFDPLLAVFGACTLLFVALCGWFALRGHRPASRARMKLAMLSGFVVGGIAFAIGFFGPLVWAPSANQGPLLGIFVTGPIGFVIGTACGWLSARMRVPREAQPGHSERNESALRSP
jgi:Na+/proline symporter